MIKKIIILANLLVLLISVRAVAQMRELTFSEKIENATYIFEGKVIHKKCFWNTPHTLIFTSNTIEVYKIFKGNITTSEVEIITEGGEMDYQIQASSHELTLDSGNVGVFFAEPTLVTDPQIKESKIHVWKVYGSTQGFIKYDLLEKTASDPFKKYTNIPDEVYKVIKDKTGKSFREVKSFNIDKQNGTKSKKERTWLRCCKKKKAKS